MAATVGRQIRLYFGGNSPADEILGVREKSLELNGEAIDITSDENSGWRTLLSNISQQDEVQITLSGVTKDTRLKTAWFANERTQPITLNYADGSSITGTFYMSSYKEGMSYKEAVTFDATLMSSGAVTYTAAP